MIQREMRFIGKDGSLGLKTGKFYVLDIHAHGVWKLFHKNWGVGVEIWGKNNRKIFCPYSNIETFLANWK